MLSSAGHVDTRPSSEMRSLRLTVRRTTTTTARQSRSSALWTLHESKRSRANSGVNEMSEDDTERQPHEYDVDKRFAHIRVDLLGQRYTDVVRVCEQFPELPDGITVYVEDIDAVDLRQTSDQPLFDELDQATFEAAVDEWGIDAQASMAEEEAAEFIVASKHYARGKTGANELIDELADLRIMYEQLAMFVGQEDVEERVRVKMNRLRERLPRDVETDTD